MKKDAFTLIELLAVIVILAVIALIVTPVISGVIDGAKKSASARSVDGFVSAVNVSVSSSILESNKMDNGRYYVDNDGNLTKAGKKYVIKINGKKPESGEVTVYNGKVIDGIININNYAFNYSNGVSTIIDGYSKKIYGLEFNKTTNTYTRLNDAAGLNSCVGTNTDTCNNDFDKAEIYRDMVEVTDSYGNVFIKIPKFYIKKEVTDNVLRWYVSRTKQDSSYYLPFCFYDFNDNKELDYVLVGKYDSNLSDDTTKLESKSGNFILDSKTLDEFRNYAYANNNETEKGYQQMDIHVWDAIKTLFYIEEGTLDAQSIMTGYVNGQSAWQEAAKSLRNQNNTNEFLLVKEETELFRVGQLIDISLSQSARDVAQHRQITSINNETGLITFSGDPVNITTSMIISNAANKTGTTDNVLTSSGSNIDNNSGKYSMNYRGIENLYGNIWQFIDGVLIDNQSSGEGSVYVNKNSLTYASSITSNYSKIGYGTKYMEGFIGTMGYDSNYPFIELPITVEDFYNSIYRDYYWKDNVAEVKVLLGGGDWPSSNIGGISTYDTVSNTTYSGIRASSRLIKK